VDSPLKKIIGVIILLVVCITLVGCNEVKKDEDYSDTATDTIFTLVDSGSRLSIYKENATDVMYVVYHAGYTGGITIMMGADGLPLTYSNWSNLR
jgi:uncharacterized lipoprotein NlpE involved in copper resistance